MRLAIVTDMLWGGGRERRIVQLIAGLNKLGVQDIHLILLDDRIDYPEVHALDVNIIKISRSSNRDFSVFPKLYRILKDIQPTIVNPWSYMSVFYAAPLCKLLGIPCVGAFVVDAKAPRFASVNWLAMHVGFRICRQIVGNSNAGHAAYGTPKAKRVVIYNGFNEDRLAGLVPSERPESPVTIAMLGRLDRQKDFRTFIDGMALLKARGINFAAYIAGQGEMKAELEAEASAKCGDSITFTGFIQNIDRFISGIDIGVLCTDPHFHAEGISNSLLEMMAQGKPVVATRGGGTPEIVDHGVNGYLIDPGDATALADRLQLLCQDIALRRALGGGALESARQKFSLRAMAESFLLVYDENTLNA